MIWKDLPLYASSDDTPLPYFPQKEQNDPHCARTVLFTQRLAVPFALFLQVSGRPPLPPLEPRLLFPWFHSLHEARF